MARTRKNSRRARQTPTPKPAVSAPVSIVASPLPFVSVEAQRREIIRLLRVIVIVVLNYAIMRQWGSADHPEAQKLAKAAESVRGDLAP